MSGDSEMDALKVRLSLTIGCGTVSILAGVAMLVAYRRYSHHVASSYNELYVLGIGGFGFAQALSAVIFAAIHLASLPNSFAGPACIANATFQQFFNLGGQVFALGFFVALLMLRGTLCEGCFKSSIMVEEVLRTQPRPKSWLRWGSRASISASAIAGGSGGLAGESCPNTPRTPAVGVMPREAATSNDRLISPRQGRHYATTDLAYTATTPTATAAHLSSSETFYSEPTFCVTHRDLVKWFWPVTAILGATITTIIMNVIVVQDPSASPTVGPEGSDPQNFQVLLGWCWIPDNHQQLRFWCSYFMSIVTFGMSVAGLVVLGRFEHGITWGLHSCVYLRLMALSGYIALAYFLGAVSIFTDDPGVTRYVSYAATAVFSLQEAWVAFVFLTTERVFYQFFSDPSATTVPGNGFSKAINHLLVIAVEGIYMPSSVNRFPTTQDRLGVIDSRHRVVDDDATSLTDTEVMSTRRLMQAYDDEFRSPTGGHSHP